MLYRWGSFERGSSARGALFAPAAGVSAFVMCLLLAFAQSCGCAPTTSGVLGQSIMLGGHGAALATGPGVMTGGGNEVLWAMADEIAAAHLLQSSTQERPVVGVMPT